MRAFGQNDTYRGDLYGGSSGWGPDNVQGLRPSQVAFGSDANVNDRIAAAPANSNSRLLNPWATAWGTIKGYFTSPPGMGIPGAFIGGASAAKFGLENRMWNEQPGDATSPDSLGGRGNGGNDTWNSASSNLSMQPPGWTGPTWAYLPPDVRQMAWNNYRRSV